MNAQSSRFPVFLTGVSHTYRGEAVPSLSGADLAVERGEVAALIGPSGAGKSTLLSLLDGRLRGWAGAAAVLGQSLDPLQAPDRAHRADIGFVFQDFALVDRATVWQNVLNGRLGRVGVLASLLGRFSEADRAAAEAAIRDTHIADLRDKRADRLSGGQRQRVAIARCLAQEPEVILADEPVSNLDPVRAEGTLRLLAETARKRNATLLFTSHQPELASLVADRLVALKNGSIVFDGKSDQLTPVVLANIYGSLPQAQGERSQSLRLVS